MSVLASVLLATQIATHVAPPAGVTASLTLDRVVVDLVNRERLKVTLHAAPLPDVQLSPIVGQRLLLAQVPIPLSNLAQPSRTASDTVVTFEVNLREVPEAVLGVPTELVPIRWEGRDARGDVVLNVMGEIDPNDGGRLMLPVDKLMDNYARLVDASVVPSLAEVAFRGLVSLYNPFNFDVVATRLSYRITVGGESVMAGTRPGFRLRAATASDVLIEQSAPLADVAAGVLGAVVGQQPVRLDGAVVIRGPQGDRAIPLRLRGAL